LFSLLVVSLVANEAFSQTGSASATSIANSTANTVTLTGTPPSGRRFISPTSWTFLSGPQSIIVSAPSFNPNQTTNNNTVTATASFPAGSMPGTYTFKLTYTVTTNTSGTTSTTGSLNVTVTVTLPPPGNPASGNASNCTTNAAITTCPVGSSGVQTSFINGVYNRGNDTNHLAAGAVWRFTNITTVSGTQVNAEVRIDAISNALLENAGSGSNTSSTAKMEDDNALNQSNVSIASYFAPRISPNASGNGNTNGYVQFTMTFFKNTGDGFTNSQNLNNLNFVHLDNDGNGNSSAWFRETGVALVAGLSNPSVIANAGTELTAYSYTDNSTSPGGSWSGYAGSVYERSGVSTCAEVAAAYRFSDSRSSVTFRLGYDYKGTGNPGTTARQYGATFGCFNFPAAIALPVKLVSFKGVLDNNTAKLTWESAVEDNIAGYIVERSFNGNDWSDVGEVPSRGMASSYSYNDPLTGNPDKIYYRLKIREMAGYSFSGVIALKMSVVIGNVNVAPNPFRDNVQLSINSSDAGNINYTLLSSEGKQLKNASEKISRGSNVFFINDLGSLQAGIYFLQVQSNGETKTIKLLKTDR